MDMHEDRNNMTMPKGNLDAYERDNGMRVRQIVPFEAWEVCYDSRDGDVDGLHYGALMVPLEVSETKANRRARGSEASSARTRNSPCTATSTRCSRQPARS
jgi:hypothetical protein